MAIVVECDCDFRKDPRDRVLGSRLDSAAKPAEFDTCAAERAPARIRFSSAPKDQRPGRLQWCCSQIVAGQERTHGRQSNAEPRTRSSQYLLIDTINCLPLSRLTCTLKYMLPYRVSVILRWLMTAALADFTVIQSYSDGDFENVFVTHAATEPTQPIGQCMRRREPQHAPSHLGARTRECEMPLRCVGFGRVFLEPGDGQYLSIFSDNSRVDAQSQGARKELHSLVPAEGCILYVSVIDLPCTEKIFVLLDAFAAPREGLRSVGMRSDKLYEEVFANRVYLGNPNMVERIP
ncbi:uncharacterized protein K460DRAFT_354349 [Cucurbitaria berberidis CBS 394.84]|uniref:Uncharacterized protein n=1 Tax=Cucurbitaria berberidis CBS 394.84 TaxID=1168544 RepID=A0A9P4GQF6_9PLEO|nr:uncharacterized protein K460DRAFT_354349 [Cucurbitaria berberidis CBS 394.84]KAF1849511.1 hypothetical protein K460DRAFT_354349 [Cucurbitaria berberidis CBS 394.84]